MTQRRLDFGSFSLDAERGELVRQGTAPVNIGRRAAALLQRLLQADGRIVAKAELIDFAWPGAIVEDSNLSVQIAALRKALDQDDGAGSWIVTVPRIGYRFAGPPVAETIVAARAATSNPDSDRRPSIAVLPFANLSGDTAQQYFADAVTEEIITALTRFRWFHVLGRPRQSANSGSTICSKAASSARRAKSGSPRGCSRPRPGVCCGATASSSKRANRSQSRIGSRRPLRRQRNRSC
jgi:DNA-binding winged helix-turn-helix (wHTH) protein